jgi:hypothetical protein
VAGYPLPRFGAADDLESLGEPGGNPFWLHAASWVPS